MNTLLQPVNRQYFLHKGTADTASASALGDIAPAAGAIAAGDRGHKDLVLNVGWQESIARGVIALFVPWPLLFIYHSLVILAAPIMMYLLFTALTHFCLIKYCWAHMIKKEVAPDPWVELDAEARGEE